MSSRGSLGVILVVAGAVRLWYLLGPHREIDADEAIVGLMALQVPREFPVFFWEQHYLGSLEAFVVALVFFVVGPSAVALKVAPAAFSVLFVVFAYASAARAFGRGPAFLVALYLAVPPSFLAIWSVKARGGYAELLALGQAFILLSQLLAGRQHPSIPLALGWGFVGGVALWTHPLAIVYLISGGLFVVLSERSPVARLVRNVLGPGCIGFLVGVSPVIAYNLVEDFPTLRYAAGGGTAPGGVLVNLWGLARYGLPVLVGLAEGTASKSLLDEDWPRRAGSFAPLAAALLIVGLWVVWSYRGSVVALIRQGRCPAAAPSPFVLLLLLVPVVVAVSRFADLWAEPRYALPIYGTVPLFAALAWRVRSWSAPGFVSLVVAVFAINVSSLIGTQPRLALPTSAGESNRANRAELIRYLLDRGLTRIYTEYWIGYPLAFESGERIVPAIRSGGFDRRQAYSHLVWVEPDPAFVFPAGALGDREFQQDLLAAGGRAEVSDVSVYRVYTHVRPLEVLRP